MEKTKVNEMDCRGWGETDKIRREKWFISLHLLPTAVIHMLSKVPAVFI